MMKEKFPGFLIHSHRPQSIAKRLSEAKEQSIVRDFIFGAIDGIVTTFSIIAGVVGAGLSSNTIIILGLANIIADGFSMAASNYLGTKSEHDQKRLITDFELHEMDYHPEGETEEIRQIFKQKGLSGETLDQAISAVVKDRNNWLQLMLSDEYGLSLNLRSPWKAGFVTFGSFILFGMIPLMPFFLEMNQGFIFSALLSAIAFFSVGALKSVWSVEVFWLSGLKTLGVGSVAAILAYSIGALLKNYV